jgi:hypothetical protein
VAAARTGARVILLERYGFLGGLATAGMVGTVCGLYHRGEDSQARYACGGFAREWAENLARRSSSEPVHTAGGLWVLPYDNWAFKRLADRTIQTTEGLEPILHATLTSVKVQGEHVVEANVLVWDRNLILRPKCIVDCTGEGTVVYLAGGSVTETTSQAAGALFTMAPVDGALQTTGDRVAVLREIADGVAQGKLDPGCKRVSFVESVTDDKQARLKLALVYDSDDPLRKMTALELRARELIDELSIFLTSNCPAFRKARLSHVAVQVGIRIGRTIKGRATLDEADVLECRKFPDGVACGVWPIEEWSYKRERPNLAYLPPGEHYEIPLKCLVSAEFENVFAAGRCISAATEAAGRALSVAVQEARGDQVPGEV